MTRMVIPPCHERTDVVSGRGGIDELPSGALRVRVYAGTDPVSRRRIELRETVPDGQGKWDDAEKVVTRLRNQVDERRHPRTNATVRHVMESHLEQLDVGPSTLAGYRGYLRRHIVPLIGDRRFAEVDGSVLDPFYKELRRCQDHCDGRPGVDHRTPVEHRCDAHEGAPCSPPDPDCAACRRRCPPHVCRPLGESTIRQIHYLLQKAGRRAVRWRWIAVNPIEQAEPPPPPTPDPRPPSVEEAAAIINEAWHDPDWGALVWLATTTGARRGELCARHCIDLERGVLAIRRSVARDDEGRWYLKDTKTHQQRRVALDPEKHRCSTPDW